MSFHTNAQAQRPRVEKYLCKKSEGLMFSDAKMLRAETIIFQISVCNSDDGVCLIIKPISNIWKRYFNNNIYLG